MPSASPRELPAQDHDAIDAAEWTARRLSLAVGAVAALVLAAMVIALGGQFIPW